MTEPLIDRPARERATGKHDQVVHVEAGAGTGKTTLLIAKYLDLIRSGRARPTEIVAVTFTEKAAAELRDRIRAKLEEEKLTEALREIDRAPISTIHAFATSCLRERPLEAGLEPSFEVLDEVSAELFLRRSYDRWLSAALSETTSPAARALSIEWNFGKLRDLAFELYAHRDLYTKIPPAPRAPDADLYFQELWTEAENLYALAEQHCSDRQDEGYGEIFSLFTDLASLRNLPTDVRTRGLMTRVEKPKAKGNQKSWTPATACKEQKERMKKLGEAHDRFQKEWRQTLLGELISWFGPFLEAVESEKRASGRLDFDDLLFLTRDLLRDHPEVRSAFAQRYRYFLIDEFQDTDPIQGELLWSLSVDRPSEAPWYEWPLVPGKLFVVGDPKQSIYRFRRADIEMYRRATAEIAKQGERLVIRQNFRSNESLIRWVNSLFAPLLGEGYEPLSADSRHRAVEGRRSVVLLQAGAEVGQGKAYEMRLKEAESVAAYLRELIDSAEPRVYDPTSDSLRAVRPGDIAVLFPTMTDVDLFEEALRLYRLPFSLEGGRLFFARAEVQAVLSTLDAIDRPTDPIAVVAALRSILFGLSADDLLRWISVEPTFDYRTGDLDRLPEPGRTACAILRELHRHRSDVPPSTLISLLYERTAAFPITLLRRHGEQAAANLEKIAALARTFERDRSASLASFVRWARERTEQADRQAESPLSIGQEDRILLMTIHTAKGLEFPVVVLANLSSEIRKGDHVIADRLEGKLAIRCLKKNNAYETVNFEEMAAREEERQTGERRRLLYVAATRARDLLVLPQFSRERGKSDYFSLLAPGWEGAVADVETVDADTLKFGALPPGVLADHEDRAEHGPPLIDRERNLLARLREREGRWKPGLAIRRATDFVEANETPSTASHGRSDRARLIGVALHRVLETVPLDSLETLPLHVRHAVSEAGDRSITEEVEKLAALALGSSLFDRVRRAKRQFRELPFSWRSESFLVEGVIDLAFEEPEGLVIVDYKTDRIESAQIEQRAALYAPQLKMYADALEHLSGCPVQEALVLFARLGAVASSWRRASPRTT